jgi:opacity protein-like surface antigen
MRNILSSSITKSACLLGMFLVTTHIASAQALVSAQRGAEIAPFAQTTIIRPDWGPTSNIGYTLGVDYTRFIRSVVQPSIEFRMTSANGTTVNERTLSGGLKLQTTIHRVHPYAAVLVGTGNIVFVHPVSPTYLSDNAMVYSLGGGADINVTSQWKVRLDFMHQGWNLGDATLTPTALGVGVSYSLPFHSGRVR